MEREQGTGHTLEIVIMWGEENVLQVDHLSPPRAYSLGDERGPDGKRTTDFVIDSSTLGMAKFPIVVESNSGFNILIPSGSMAKIETHKGCFEAANIRAFPGCRRSTELAGAVEVPAQDVVGATIECSGFVVHVRSVTPAKREPVPLVPEKRPLAYVAGSAAFFGMIVGSFYFLPPLGSAVNYDLLEADSRMVDYLALLPEAEINLGPGTEKNSVKSENRGAGVQPRGPEGKAGQDTALETRGLGAIEGKTRSRRRARHSAQPAAAHAAGVLGILEKIDRNVPATDDPFAPEAAAGQDVDDAVGSLIGGAIGGGPGMATAGVGPGGDGVVPGPIAVGPLRTIGAGIHAGAPNRIGSMTSDLRGPQHPVPPTFERAAVSVRGSLSKEVIRRVVRLHRSEVKHCYEQALVSSPNIHGRVTIQFVIASSGAVQSARVESSSLQSLRVEQCVANAVKRWSFDAPEGGGAVIVRYPFLFASTEN